jgi:hypothetical protein
MRVRILAAPFVTAVLVAGCSDASGPKAYRLSGEAKVDGQPIPHGDVLFTPDGAAGNSGPQGIATITNGKYDTGKDGKGVAGGPTVVRVTGLDKPGGKVLCEYEYKVDLPKQDSTLDINVPGKAGPVVPKKAAPEI